MDGKEIEVRNKGIKGRRKKKEELHRCQFTRRQIAEPSHYTNDTVLGAAV